MGYFTNVYPESESTILPTVWVETGVEIFGRIFNFDYNLALVNGLDAAGFSSERWVATGYQTKYELIKASNLATVLRLNFVGIEHTTIGVGGYYGNSTDNRPKPEDMEGIDANVSVLSLHGRYDDGDLKIRTNLIYGNLSNSALVSERNARLSVNSQNPRTPVAKNAMGYYIELGYNVAPLIGISKEIKFFHLANTIITIQCMKLNLVFLQTQDLKDQFTLLDLMLFGKPGCIKSRLLITRCW